MNYDFLQNYNIPIARQDADNQYTNYNQSTMEGAYGTYSMQSTATPAVNSAYYGYGTDSTYNGSYMAPPPETTRETYQNPERFIPPSKHGTGYVPFKTGYKRKFNAVGGGGVKKEAAIVEVTTDGKLVMFMGRDESYPDELNSLIHPLSCDLCNIKMNSKTSAKDHYESKVHDKNISSWLFKNYTEKGENPPPVKRFIKEGPCGPDAYYCEVCDLKLTSLTHANQHYAGKKHQMVIAQRAKPSGAGYYNAEGKWVRTGTKLIPKGKDQRFGIGETMKSAAIGATSANVNNSVNAQPSNSSTTTSIADTTTNESEGKQTKSENKKTLLKTTSDQDPSMFCSICKVSVTSAVQMTMHLSGSKHLKKLKLSGINPTPIATTIDTQSATHQTLIADNILLSAIKDEINPDDIDLSMYRTPSGQYYCKTCNTSISHLPGLEQHLKGKRHLKKLTEEKALATLAVKKN